MKWIEGRPANKMNFNGRQIRNIVSTALGIAIMDDKDDGEGNIGNGLLKKKHVEQVAEQTMAFKLDLKSQEDAFKRITK